MIATRELVRFTPEEYLAWEVQQELRYEYIDGEVYAMSGGTLPHGLIGLNFASSLKFSLRGRGCLVLNSDCKVGVSDEGPFTYPDASVTCENRDRIAQKFARYPCLIAEVLSPSTEAYDRGGKFALYRRLDSLQEYVLIGSQVKSVEVFRRNDLGQWIFTAYEEGESIQLMGATVTVTFDEIYENVILDTLEVDTN